MRNCSKREEAFCLGVFENEDFATDAYFSAYPNFKGTRKTAGEKASKLLKKDKIRARIKELRAAAAQPAIMKLAELGLFWTGIVKNEKNDLMIRLSASKTLAEYSLKVFERAELAKQAEASEPGAQEKDKGPLLDFTEFCLKVGYPKPYPKQIQMADFILQSKPGQLLGARNYGKTDYGVICKVAHHLQLNPNDTFLLVTKEKDRGKDIVAEVRRALGIVGFQFSIDQATGFNILGHIGKDPTFKALPLRSKAFRGRHPKYIICDDIVTPDDCSAAERKKAEDVWAELIKLTPNICLIGQPAHAKDIYAKMRAENGVRKLELPYGSIPELDVDLEAQRAAGVSEASIQASYYLKIEATDTMPFAGLEIVNFFPSNGCAGFVDPADDGNDSTSFVGGAQYGDQFILAGFEFEKSWDSCLENIQAVYGGYKMGKFAFETNKLGNHPVRLLRDLGANVTGWNTTATASGPGAGQSKHGRILNAATFRNYLKLSTYIPEAIKTPELVAANKRFIERVKDYEARAKHKDSADAIAGLLIYLGYIKR